MHWIEYTLTADEVVTTKWPYMEKQNVWTKLNKQIIFVPFICDSNLSLYVKIELVLIVPCFVIYEMEVILFNLVQP